MAAVRVADTDGLDAVSIRRIAAGIGPAPTALYRYVARKDELLGLMVDAVLGEEGPPEHSDDWRRDLRGMAECRRIGLAHPWLAHTPPARPSLGPNSLRWMEFAFGAFDGIAGGLVGPGYGCTRSSCLTASAMCGSRLERGSAARISGSAAAQVAAMLSTRASRTSGG